MATGRASDLVFPSKSGAPLSHRNVQSRGFDAAARLAGIDGVSFHSLRHAFASRMIFRGTSPSLLARLMGHEVQRRPRSAATSTSSMRCERTRPSAAPCRADCAKRCAKALWRPWRGFGGSLSLGSTKLQSAFQPS